MMKAIKVFMILAAFSFTFIIATLSVRSQTGVIVNNADSVTDKGIPGLSGAINTLLNQVTPRVMFEFANSNRTQTLPSLPSALDTRLNLVMTRVIFEFANSSRNQPLPSLPSALDTHLDLVAPRVMFEFSNSSRSQKLPSLPSLLNGFLSQVAPRVTYEFANSSRQQELTYPQAILNDNAPPQIASIESEPAGDTSTDISWTTDEYANGTVQCGTQPGVYTMTFSAPLYAKMHVVTLTGLTAGTTYYCQISSTDLSGNTSQSLEFSFEQLEEFFIYLPSVIR